MSEEIPSTPLKKLTIEDLISSGCITNNKDNINLDSNHIPKNQKVFGHNKRIKPWRTGTKSQQQIAPRGFKKGFRG